MCSSGPLRLLTVLIGGCFGAASLAGVAASLYLLFGEPLGDYSRGTYTPNAEDIGPALVCSVISLVMSVVLVGGALQHSHNMLLAWLVWQVVLLIVFWAWYAYNQLKHHGYIEWRGMRGCYFCGLRPHEANVSSGGAVASFVVITAMIIVTFLHAIYKRRHRELTDPAYFLGHQPNHASLTYPYQYRSEHGYLMTDLKSPQQQQFEEQQQQQQVNNYHQQLMQKQYLEQQQQQLLLQQQYYQQQMLLQQQQRQQQQGYVMQQ